jgi:hypothetical protein
MAERAALTWRVSSSTASKPALCNGPASRPTRAIATSRPCRKATNASGSLATFASRMTAEQFAEYIALLITDAQNGGLSYAAMIAEPEGALDALRRALG